MKARSTLSHPSPCPDYPDFLHRRRERNPPAIAEAAEAGNDVPALVLKETKDMITEKKVQLLAYNEQTSTSRPTRCCFRQLRTPR